MKNASLLLLALFSVSALAQTPLQKAKDPSELSEADLKAIAERELGAIPSGGSIAPFSLPEDSLVSTAELVKEEAPEPLSSSEIEIGLQAFRPEGSGRLSASETYSYAALSSQPMAWITGRHWFVRNPLRSSFPWRAGLGVSGGFATHSLKIETNRGTAYDNVRLNSFLVAAGPEAEVFVDNRLRWAVGGRFFAGKNFSVQSTPVSSLDRTQNSSIWEAAAHLRFQPVKSFFARLAYARRGILGASEDLSIQENNYAAYIGFGM